MTARDSGVISINGGKLTTYREMAADTVDEVVDHLGHRAPRGHARRSRTRRLVLRGATGHDTARTTAVAGLSPEQVEHLAGRHGGESPVLFAMVQADPDLARPLVEGLAYLRAEAVYAARYEMVATVDDVLSRRTRARLLAAEASVAAAPDVADLVGDELGWSADERREQVEAYRDSVKAELERRRPVRRGPRLLMTTAVAPGQPTAPITLGDDPAATTDRIAATAVEVDDALLARLRGVCAEVSIDDAERAEAGRDWWPLAMTWALAGQVGHRPAAVARPATDEEVAAVLAVCHQARRARHRRRRPQRGLRGLGTRPRGRPPRPVRPVRHPFRRHDLDGPGRGRRHLR